MNDLGKKPDLRKDFPSVDSDLKINPDLENQAHGGPHFDVMKGLPDGIDKTRVSPDGEVMGGTTQIGKTKLDW